MQVMGKMVLMESKVKLALKDQQDKMESMVQMVQQA